MGLPGENVHFGILTSLLYIAGAPHTRMASSREFSYPKEGARKEQFMKASRFGKVFFAILLVGLFVTISAYPQVGTTSVRGVVTDKSGAAIVGAKVTLSSTAQAFRREMQTSQAGEYAFLALPPPTYAPTVQLAT